MKDWAIKKGKSHLEETGHKNIVAGKNTWYCKDCEILHENQGKTIIAFTTMKPRLR